MTVKNLFDKLFKRKKESFTWKLEKGHVVDEAFELNGESFYMIKDVYNTYAERGLYALQVYEDWNKRCTKEYLLAHATSVRQMYNSKSIILADMIKANEDLLQRLNFVIPTEDIIWKMCSVMFFDKSESPYRYDPEYAKTKIAKWKKSGKVYDFFLYLRINQLIPLPETSEEDFNLFLKAVNQYSQSQLDFLLSKLTSNQQKAGYFSELNYQRSLISTGIN